MLENPKSVGGGGTSVSRAAPNDAATWSAPVAVTFAALPRGIIVMWSGSTNAVPEGWALCNGGNSTPNLVDRFIVGAGSSYSVGSTGGSNTHSHGVYGSVDSTTLSVSQMPSHKHQYSFTRIRQGDQLAGPGGAIVDGYLRLTDPEGGSQSHYHSLSSASTYSANNTPYYYSLAYIMKL